MSTNNARGRPRRPHEPQGRNVSESYQLGHSRVVLERGPAGTLARVEKPDGTDYAGPLPEQTIEAIREVGE